jgi:hypothetical protein
MLKYEHTVDVTATAAQLWARYTDVATWTEWDDGLDEVTLDGPFAVGSRGTLTPGGQEPLPFTLTDVVENEGFSDETEIPGQLLLRFVHRLVPLPGGGTRVTHRLEIEGPAAAELGPRLGPEISAGFPHTIATLGVVAAGTEQSA